MRDSIVYFISLGFVFFLIVISLIFGHLSSKQVIKKIGGEHEYYINNYLRGTIMGAIFIGFMLGFIFGWIINR